MLRFNNPMQAPRRSTGFSLVELMISLVLGSILIASVLTLVVSILGSNAETIKATRLTQELRTLVEVIGREAERARLMDDPLGNVGNPPKVTGGVYTGATNPNTLIDDSTAGCLRFSYFDAGGNRAVTFRRSGTALLVGAVPNAAAENWAHPDGSTRVRTALLACSGATTRLSSPEIAITDFVIETQDDIDTAPADGLADCDQPDSIVQLRITGNLVNDVNVTRTVNDRIRVGAADLKTDITCF